jgi:hypothetical protein
MSLFSAPNRESIDTTSNSSHPPVYTLNNDVLLNILFLYRLSFGDEDDDYYHYGMYYPYCERQRWWYNLAQVSRQWRYVILASKCLLDLHLLCTYGVPVAEMLAHSPALPLIIFYNKKGRDMTAEDEEGILLALSHRDRVHGIHLEMPTPKLGKFITAMDEQFPILENLYVNSLSPRPSGLSGETCLTLPGTFKVPNLRQVLLAYIALPIRSPLFTPTVGLVFLWLWGIP